MKKEKSRASLLPIKSLLEAVFTDAVDGMLVVDQEGYIKGTNAAVKAIFGYEDDELIGQQFSILLPKFNSQGIGVSDIIAAALGKHPRMGKGFEVIGLKKDGNEIPVFLSISKFKAAGKTFYSNIIHDLSEFKENQQALMTERDLLQKYLYVTNSLIIELDEKGQILLFNQKSEEITEYSRQEVMGKNWFELVLESNLTDVFKRDWESIFNGERKLIEFLTHKITTKSGKTKIIKWHSIINKDVNGKPTSVLASGIDITKLMDAERKLKLLNSRLEKEVENRTNELVNVVNRLTRTNKKLDIEITERERAEIALRKSETQLRTSLEKEVELNQLKSRFLSMASHEFKTPISTILSSISIMQKYEGDNISDKKLKHIDRIKGALNHMTYMLDKFFSISQFEEGKINAEAEYVPLNNFSMSIIEAFHANLKEGQSIVLESLETDFDFYTDKNLLKNILLNLLSNASKYSGPNAEIILKTMATDQEIIFEVADNGLGIPEEDQKYLFTRFYRSDKVAHIKGTGIGLNIVRDYVQILNGKISVKSKEGEGSTFRISFNKMPKHEKDSSH